MTPDIKRLRDSLDQLAQQVDYLELELVDDPDWPDPSDTSYLREDDRANPDIMANVEAMAETNKRIAWFGRDQEGFVGLWRDPAELPLAQAPIVRLDTEGQYELVATTIGNYLAISVDEDDFDDARRVLIEAGFEVAASAEAIWASLDGLQSPNDHRHRLYNEERDRRGLPPVDL